MKDSGSYNLLDYVGFLEKELKAMREEIDIARSKHEEEKIRLKRRLEAALEKSGDVQGQNHSNGHGFLKSGQLLLQEKVLEDRVKKLELELEMKNDQQINDERAMQQLENENELMKKQAIFGWMLGCLSEIYLQEESKGGAIPLLIQKMMTNIQEELERENVVLTYSGESPLEQVENEIRRLNDSARLLESDAQPSSTVKDIQDDKPFEGDHKTDLLQGNVERNGMNQKNKTLTNSTRSQSRNRGGDGPQLFSTKSKSEANPRVDMEPTQVSGGTRADVKVMNTNDNVLDEQTDIKGMLLKLQATLDKHLALQVNNTTCQSRSLAKLLNQPKKTHSSPRKISKLKPQR